MPSDQPKPDFRSFDLPFDHPLYRRDCRKLPGAIMIVMPTSIYKKYVECEMEDALADLVDTMTHDQRIALRTALEAEGCNQLLRSLYYDYARQCWIGG